MEDRSVVFNSYSFVLAFLPAFVFLYLLFGRRSIMMRKTLLIIGSAVFYVCSGWKSSLVLGLSIAINYLLSMKICRAENKKSAIALAVLFNVGLLFGFKYISFALQNLEGFTGLKLPHPSFFLPMGISFFTFQQIMYSVSVGKGETKPELLDYLAYILFFPRMMMGPLMEPSDFFHQLRKPVHKGIDWENLAVGLKLFSLGLFKKMLLADTFAKAVSWGFENGAAAASSLPLATSYDLLLVMLSYTFQIYFDFSGYTDMATGVAKMMGFDLPVNFNSPYRAFSIRDFWRRWHISLTSFLTKYVYYPLGGSRKGSVRTYVNIITVFLISGIWHGASWTFVLWGCLHGLLQILERASERWFSRVPRLFRWGVTFLSVNLLWLLFRAESIGDWIEMTGRMFSMKYRVISSGLIDCFGLPEVRLIMNHFFHGGFDQLLAFFSMWFLLGVSFLLCLLPGNPSGSMKKKGPLQLLLYVLLLLWGILCMSGESVFIYSGF